MGEGSTYTHNGVKSNRRRENGARGFLLMVGRAARVVVYVKTEKEIDQLFVDIRTLQNVTPSARWKRNPPPPKRIETVGETGDRWRR